jgi:hypothetical protein
MLWVEVMGVTLVLEAEFLGSKRGYWSGLKVESWVSGGWADHLSLRFEFWLENLSVCVWDSVLQCTGVEKKLTIISVIRMGLTSHTWALNCSGFFIVSILFR